MRRHPCVQCIAVPPHSRGVVDVDVDVDVDERAIARGAPRCERGECHRLSDMAGDTAAILGSISIKSRVGYGLVLGVIAQQTFIGLMHMT